MKSFPEANKNYYKLKERERARECMFGDGVVCIKSC